MEGFAEFFVAVGADVLRFLAFVLVRDVLLKSLARRESGGAVVAMEKKVCVVSCFLCRFFSGDFQVFA